MGSASRLGPFPSLCKVTPDLITSKLRDPLWFLNAGQRQSLSLIFKVLHNPAPVLLSKLTLFVPSVPIQTYHIERSQKSHFEGKDCVSGLLGHPESGPASGAAVMLRNCRKSCHACQLGPDGWSSRAGAWNLGQGVHRQRKAPTARPSTGLSSGDPGPGMRGLLLVNMCRDWSVGVV